MGIVVNTETPQSTGLTGARSHTTNYKETLIHFSHNKLVITLSVIETSLMWCVNRTEWTSGGPIQISLYVSAFVKRLSYDFLQVRALFYFSENSKSGLYFITWWHRVTVMFIAKWRMSFTHPGVVLMSHSSFFFGPQKDNYPDCEKTFSDLHDSRILIQNSKFCWKSD